MATGNKPLQDLSTAFVIITEYNLKTQGFLVAGVERIVNMNWGDIHPPPKGTGREHYLTAVTHLDDHMVEIIDVEKSSPKSRPSMSKSVKAWSAEVHEKARSP